MSDLDKQPLDSPEDGHQHRRPSQVETPSTRWASMFGGKGVSVGPRIAPVAEYLKSDAVVSESDTADDILQKQIDSEASNAIQYRTCSWKKTACLLFSEYIVLSIMGFPWNYSVLGLGPALVVTLVVAGIVLYTSLVLWEFCLRHPEVRDISDIGQMLFWGKKWAWWATAVMFVLNNTFIQALHVLVGAVYLNTMTEADTIRGCRTVAFAVVVTALSFLGSIPRTFSLMSHIAFWSAAFTFVSVITGTIFAGIQDHPAGYDPEGLGEPHFRAGPPPTTTFVLGLTAVLNISYTFIGQLTLPSFIAEMRDPRDFPKALWACTMAEIVLFCIVGSVIYTQVGEQYITAPAFGALEDVYKKISYSFMIPTIIFVGCLYASVTARFIFFRWFKDSKHMGEHTVIGWLSWLGILLGSWALAFIIAEVIPIFNSLLSLMGSIFNCWFGFIFWGVAYFRMRSADKKVGRHRGPILDALSVVLNIFIIACGIFFLGCGTYASVQGIIDSYAAGTVAGVFQCESNGL